MKFRIVLAVFLSVLATLPAHAQSDPETLADIRQQLNILYNDIEGLKRELSTTGSGSSLSSGGTMQERLDALEFALQRLTAQTERLENRVNRIVADGTIRIDDLEWRLVELEGGDLDALEETTTLGGEPEGPVVIGEDNDPGHTGPELAVAENDDFNLALEAYDAGEFQTAVSRFEAFTNTYPEGPLSGAAHLYRGLALDGIGQTGQAARAYLSAYSSNPDGAEAPAALFQLGLSLHALGQTAQACTTLGEVAVRFPGDAMVDKAVTARTRIGCS